MGKFGMGRKNILHLMETPFPSSGTSEEKKAWKSEYSRRYKAARRENGNQPFISHYSTSAKKCLSCGQKVSYSSSSGYCRSCYYLLRPRLLQTSQDQTALLQKNQEFIKQIQEQSRERLSIMDTRLIEGENNRIPMDQMFLNGWRTLLDILWMKVNRLAGYADLVSSKSQTLKGQSDKILEELGDVGNYADWAAVLVKIELERRGLHTSNEE